MKSLPVILAGALTFFGLSTAASAQNTPWYAPTGFYGSLGYSNLDSTSSPKPDISAITGRIGARFGPYLGVEGEGSFGVGSSTDTANNGDLTRTHLDNQYAGYVVGFLPVMPHLDLLARVGYGGQQWNVRDDSLATAHDHQFDSVNYGVGAQYDFNGKDGVRLDYTRLDASDRGDPSSNVWGVDYVRKF